MAKVQEGLKKIKREREANQGWFESWFDSSPWLSVLISTLMGPLVILLLLLTFYYVYSIGLSNLGRKDWGPSNLWFSTLRTIEPSGQKIPMK